jgi:hypothetical protein
MVVATLVTLASVPMLAVVLAASASLTTTGNPRSPVAAEPPQGPVVVPGRGDAGPSPAASAPAGAEPAKAEPTGEPTPPPPTPATQPADLPAPPSGDAVTVIPRSPRDESAPQGGSGSRPGPGAAPAPWTPAPSSPAPGGGQPECTPGGDTGVIDIVGDLLGEVARLLGHR